LRQALAALPNGGSVPSRLKEIKGIKAMPLLSTGWRFVRLDDAYDVGNALFDARDLGLSECHCDKCHRRIRWVHVLTHEYRDKPIGVGKCCARRLCCDGYDPEIVERNAIKRAQRRMNFTNSLRWKYSKKGNLWRKFRGYHVVILPDRYRPDYYRYSVQAVARRQRKPQRDRPTIYSYAIANSSRPIGVPAKDEAPVYSPVLYATEAEAIAGAFATLERMRPQAALSQPG